MATLWVVQVLLLNNFYGTMKTSQTQRVAKEINSEFRHNNSEDFLKKVDSISDSYDMYIYVVSYDGKTTYHSPSVDDFARTPGFEMEEPETFDAAGAEAGADGGAGAGVAGGSVTGVAPGNGVDAARGPEEEASTPYYPMGMYTKQLQKLNERMLKSDSSVYMKFEGPDKSQQILACGEVLHAKGKEDLIVYIFSPLWPISSTVIILANQLLIVTLVSLIVACIISLYLSTRISRPIRKIQRSARRLAAGEYGIIFKGGHYSEINELADTLTGASIELEKSDLVQKDLIANVSHDLRTPLTMIKSYAEMIRDISGDNPEKRDAHLQVIIDETDRLNGLVEDLLAVSRAQSGKMTLEKSVFNLGDAVESIVNTYKVMEEEGLHFEYACPADFMVEADEEKIKQVVSNLISNAVKFCGDDGIINVSLVRKGRLVRCYVEDRGPGISAEDLDHIWDRYYRASNNMNRPTDGTGLGLSICKEILTLHRADFGVESTVGQGTTFWFDLKLV